MQELAGELLSLVLPGPACSRSTVLEPAWQQSWQRHLFIETFSKPPIFLATSCICAQPISCCDRCFEFSPLSDSAALLTWLRPVCPAPCSPLLTHLFIVVLLFKCTLDNPVVASQVLAHVLLIISRSEGKSNAAMSFTQASYSLVIDSSANTDAVQPTAAELDRLYRKLSWCLMPLFCLCIMLNYLDRTSLAFASIQMTEQLQFSPEVMGLGGGLFFISYCLMQVRACRCRRVCAHTAAGLPCSSVFGAVGLLSGTVSDLCYSCLCAGPFQHYLYACGPYALAIWHHVVLGCSSSPVCCCPAQVAVLRAQAAAGPGRGRLLSGSVSCKTAAASAIARAHVDFTHCDSAVKSNANRQTAYR